MSKLFIEIIVHKNNGVKKDPPEISLPIPSFLAIYVYRYLLDSSKDDIQLFCLEVADKSEPNTELRFNEIPIKSVSVRKSFVEKLIRKNCELFSNEENEAIRDLQLPIFHRQGSGTFISGICSVCRAIVYSRLLSTSNNARIEQLLGFKKSSLLAPCEVSPWTRFCEVTIVEALMNSSDKIPKALYYFESHMSNPVRAHNIYKLAREIIQGQKKPPIGLSKDCTNLIARRDVEEVNSISDPLTIDQSLPKEQLPLEHRYAEGVYFTIADLLLYPSIRLITNRNPHLSSKSLPLINFWIKEINNTHPKCERILNELCDFALIARKYPTFTNNCPENPSNSLSIGSNDLKPALCTKTLLSGRRKYCREPIAVKDNVDIVLEKLKNINTNFSQNLCSELENSQHSPIDWNRFESLEGSGLPEERLMRKRQQLENVVYAVESIAKDGDRIVDFCSGIGHLGILLAMRLPNCIIILMENKSFSLRRARMRVESLGLTNIRFYQCNIDYYRGQFDVGTSLHACGSATDIVLGQCYRANAKFVCCPCCYGSVQSIPSSYFKYPASQQFINSNISLKNFITLAHCADQAHATGTLNCQPELIAKGRLCMKAVDTDRKLFAEELGYMVSLTQLKPETCTPKNHLLVGIK